MQQVYKTIILGMLLVAMNLVSVSTLASTSVAKVIVSIGDVVAIDASGQQRALKRRSQIFEGDTIKLAENSSMQARFIDNQLLALKQNTIFRIDEYKFKGQQDGSESAAMTLLKGGMRSVTGAIGKVNKQKYKVKTPVATLGVRGTHYVLQLCESNCGEDTVNGLYGSVIEGSVVLKNDGGQQEFGEDQFFHIETTTTPPRIITTPPAIVVVNEATIQKDQTAESLQTTAENNVVKFTADTSGSSLEDSNNKIDAIVSDISINVEPIHIETVSLPISEITNITTITYTSGTQTVQTVDEGIIEVSVNNTTLMVTSPVEAPINGSPAPAGSGIVAAGITVDKTSGDISAGGTTIVQGESTDTFSIATIGMADNQLVSIDESGMAQKDVIVYDNGVLTEVGGNGTIGVNWGRWSSGVKVFDNGVEQQGIPNGIQFAYSPNITTPAQMTATVSALMMTPLQTYNLSMGPPIRDETGAVITGTGSIDVDFSITSVTAFSYSGTGNSRTYNLSSTNTVNFAALATGEQLNLVGSCNGGTCGGGTTLTGLAGGQFVGPNAEGIIGYFGASNPGVGVGISGVGLLLR